MQIKIITEVGVTSIDNVKSITLPTYDGERTLLNKHSDTMIALGFGKGYLKLDVSKEKFVLSGGIASLDNNVLTLIPERFSFSKYSNVMKYDDTNFLENNKFIKLLETINEIN